MEIETTGKALVTAGIENIAVPLTRPRLPSTMTRALSPPYPPPPSSHSRKGGFRVMMRMLTLTAVALLAVALPAGAAHLTGQYVECRTCDVYTGPCFANAEMNLGGHQALLGWKVEKGSLAGASLDGLSVVAVVVARDTLGLAQTGPARAVLIVDKKADARQRDALVRLAKEQGGDLLKNVVEVQTSAVEFDLCPCKQNGCARVTAGTAKLETRCLDPRHDKKCGNESAYYPPLVKNVKAQAAVAVEHGYKGKALNQTWTENERRGAYVGTFEVR